MVTLDSLEATVKQLMESMDSNMKALCTEVADLKTTISSVETQMDMKIDGLRSLVNTEIKHYVRI